MLLGREIRENMTISATVDNARTKTAVGRHDRLFYTGMSIAMVIAVFVGFAPSYYLKDYFGRPPLLPLVHVHGLVFTTWIVLFFVQTVLIASHRVSVHRRLGIAGAALAALLVMVGVATAVGFARRNVASGGTATLAFLATPFGDMLVFAILATAGLLYRRRPETHKRLMLVATIGLLDAAISRWPLAILRRGPVAFFLVTDLFVLAGVCYDLASRRRIHPAYVWSGLLLMISQPVRLAISHTDAWLALAGKLVR
jgi:hypothetical protein